MTATANVSIAAYAASRSVAERIFGPDGGAPYRFAFAAKCSNWHARSSAETFACARSSPSHARFTSHRRRAPHRDPALAAGAARTRCATLTLPVPTPWARDARGNHRPATVGGLRVSDDSRSPAQARNRGDPSGRHHRRRGHPPVPAGVECPGSGRARPGSARTDGFVGLAVPHGHALRGRLGPCMRQRMASRRGVRFRLAIPRIPQSWGDREPALCASPGGVRPLRSSRGLTDA